MLGETRIVADEGLIRNWLQQGPVVQVAVDNQKFFCAANANRDEQRAPQETMGFFAQNLGDFTAHVAETLPTLNIMALLCTSAVRRLEKCGYQAQTVRYHAPTLCVDPAEGSVPENEIEIMAVDVFNANFAAQPLHVKNGTMWDFNPAHTSYLRNKLETLGGKRYFVHGVYGDICVDDFIGGVYDDSDVLVDPDLVWSHAHHRPMTADEAAHRYRHKGVLVTAPGLGRRIVEKHAL